jgi:hypothetical protein
MKTGVRDEINQIIPLTFQHIVINSNNKQKPYELYNERQDTGCLSTLYYMQGNSRVCVFTAVSKNK